MIKLIPIKISDLKQYIAIGFQDDEDMQEKYRTHTGSFEDQMEYNYRTITDEVDKGIKMECYKVLWREDVIGFTVLIKSPVKILYSFAINVNYRKREMLSAWVKAINKIMKGKYFISLYDKNTRAIDFWAKNGFKNKSYHEENNFVLLSK